MPDRLARGPDGEDEEQFEEHNRGEGDGPRSRGVRARVEFQLEDAERPDREDSRHDDNQEQDVPGEDAFLRIAGRSLHDVRRVRIDTEGERRETVRDQVDPQELNGREEREELAVEDRDRRDEHDEDLPGVRG